MEPDETTEINEAFEIWWKGLGENMPRTPNETDQDYRKRSARSAFTIASATFLLMSED